MAPYSYEVLADSPLVYLRCDEASGNLADSSGNGRTATAVGTPKYKYESPLLREPADTAVYFDDSADEFTLAHSSALQLNSDFTIETWVRWHPTGRSTSDFPSLLRKGSPSSDGWMFYAVAQFSTSWPAFKCLGFDFGTVALDFTKGPKWNHLGCTWRQSDGQFDFYINGQRDNCGLKVFSAVTSAAVVEIGNGDSSVTPASMDEVAIYATRLSPERMLAHYQAGAIQPLGRQAAAVHSTLSGF